MQQLITFDYSTQQNMESIKKAIVDHTTVLRIQNKIEVLKELYNLEAIDRETYVTALNQIYENA